MDKYEKIREINSWLDMHLEGISGSQLGSCGTWVQHVGRIYSDGTYRIPQEGRNDMDFRMGAR